MRLTLFAEENSDEHCAGSDSDIVGNATFRFGTLPQLCNSKSDIFRQKEEKEETKSMGDKVTSLSEYRGLWRTWGPWT